LKRREAGSFKGGRGVVGGRRGRERL
jgi:hypothetical protein